jgi:glucuronosyltransferase
MQETINRGVPLLGIPIFGDQNLNMERAVSAGYGIMVEFSNVTEESLTWAIRETLENPRYVSYTCVLYQYYSHKYCCLYFKYLSF